MGSRTVSVSQDRFRLNAAKLAPAISTAKPVPRSTVCSILRTTPATLATLIAPAGFGKTTAMSLAYNELKASGCAAAWLSLDPADNDCGTLSLYVEASLREIFPDAFNAPPDPEVLYGEVSASNSRIYRLLDEISFVDGPFILFIDELEHLTDPEAMGLVNRMLGVLGPGQRMVIGARRSTGLQLGRLRVDGRLVELGPDELAFSEAETQSFVLENMGGRIGEEGMRSLHRQTEGWPAALQLASIATRLGKSGAPAFPDVYSGSLADYLAEEVVNALPAGQRDFLLRSSLFDTFCAEMYDEVFGATDGEEWIAKTVSDNLFLNRTDGDGVWYRYHPLFHDFLKRAGDRHTRSDVQACHLRAANWLARAGKTGSAIAHAFLADDHDVAASLIRDCAMSHLRSGQLSMVCAWVDALPRACLTRYPEILVAGAYAHAYRHRYGEARRLIEILDSAGPIAAKLEDDVLLIRIVLELWADNIGLAFRIARENQGKLKSSDPYTIGLINYVLASDHATRGQLFDGLRHVAAAKHALSTVDAPHALAYSTAMECAISLAQGDAREAYARASSTFSKTAGSGRNPVAASPVAAAQLLDVAYEMNDLALVESLADGHLLAIRKTCIPDRIIVSYRAAARTYAIGGQGGRALELLNSLQDLGDSRGIMRFSAAARIDRIWMALTDGDLSTAGRLLPLVTSKSIWEPFEGLWTLAEDLDDAEISLFRFALLAGDHPSLVRQIEEAVNRAQAANRGRRVLRLKCLLAQSHERFRRRQKALDILEDALRVAQRGGLVRVFADESWCLMPLLEAMALRPTAVSPAYLSSVLAAARQRSPGGMAGGVPEEPAGKPVLGPRERQILTLLAEGLSNKELAARISVAESTVETYLHRINTKLGTRSRTQAIARGREMGLIC